MSSRERKRDIHPYHTFKRKPRAANCELNLRWHGTRHLFCFIFLTCQYLREKAPYSVFDFKLLQFICLFVWLCTFLFISPEKLSIGRSIIEMIKNINLFLIIFFLKDAACHILCFFLFAFAFLIFVRRFFNINITPRFTLNTISSLVQPFMANTSIPFISEPSLTYCVAWTGAAFTGILKKSIRRLRKMYVRIHFTLSGNQRLCIHKVSEEWFDLNQDFIKNI